MTFSFKEILKLKLHLSIYQVIIEKNILTISSYYDINF